MSMGIEIASMRPVVLAVFATLFLLPGGCSKTVPSACEPGPVWFVIAAWSPSGGAATEVRLPEQVSCGSAVPAWLHQLPEPPA